MNSPVSSEYLSTFLNPEHSVLSDPEKNIIETLSTRVIMHSRLQEARALMQCVATENQSLSEPRHAILIGEAGCGKSTLLDMIVDELPPKEEAFTLGIRTQQTILVLSLPSTITPRSMAIQMLRALGDQTTLNGTCQELTERLVHYIRQCNVQLVFLDEFQHLLALGRGTANGANKRLVEARNWIKSIINATHVTFVLMGMPETLTLIESEPQLERRFTHLYTLEPFNVPSKADLQMVQFADALMSATVTDLGFRSAEWFSSRPDDAMRLYVATSGVPSTIKDLIIRAALIAHRQGDGDISMVHFAQAFSRAKQARLEMEAARLRRDKRRNLVSALEGRVLNPFAAKSDEIRPLVLMLAA